ncbi:MAG TPA: response regulator, partial [Chloroflexia bacterium]|nr:response regulator [Chloroflexia bacterium]
ERAVLGTVLVIDDDVSTRDVVTRYLQAEGIQVVSAADGETGLLLARMVRPAVILLDVLLPHVDGWAILAALRSDPELAAIPVVLATILDQPEQGIALGAAEYLTKPIDATRLLTTVRRLSPTARGAARAAGRVLLVEDDAPTRALLRRTLEEEGWQVDEAADGQAALTQMAAPAPDLVLLDLMMPRVDGFQVVQALQADPAWCRIPVIVITAHDLDAPDRARLTGAVQTILQKGDGTGTALLREVRKLVLGHLAVARS